VKKTDPESIRQSAAELLTWLLVHRRERIASGTLSDPMQRHFIELCSTLLWKHSEAHGKYNGCRYWSLAARESVGRHGVQTSRIKFGNDALRHEHVFPRKQLIGDLFKIEHPTPPDVRAILDRLNIGVVVTVEEDMRLAAKGCLPDPWQRYRDANVQLADD
jgi:hypothetical protein